MSPELNALWHFLGPGQQWEESKLLGSTQANTRKFGDGSRIKFQSENRLDTCDYTVPCASKFVNRANLTLSVLSTIRTKTKPQWKVSPFETTTPQFSENRYSFTPWGSLPIPRKGPPRG